ncbi:MAG: hypothetical protein IJ331_07395, partial [Ruminococcus sp.]|nr:hypothetical protein [Ruminococcus sp.]
EKMESMVFCCPSCKSVDSLHSSKDTVCCKECNSKFVYDEYGNISGVEYKNVKELFVFLRDKALDDAQNNVTYTSDFAKIISVSNHVETVVSEGKLFLSSEIVSCGDKIIKICDIDDFAMHGRNALVLSTKDAYYEILVSEDTSALKFFMLYQAYKTGDINRFSF